MPMITRTTIDRVREAVDMVDVVSAYTDLKQQGHNYTGLCPFHDERTPSFSIDPLQKVFYCFGCEAGGDVFRFIQEKEGLDFNESVEQLADRCSVDIEYDEADPESAKRREIRDRVLALLEQAAEFYSKYLWESEEGKLPRSYLERRGLGQEVLKKFRVGYAAGAWDRLLKLGLKSGYSEDELLGAGLITKGEKGRTYDRFRERIIFPLSDARGRILGFGARAIKDSQKPKYVNSPEGLVYHKGDMLFGLHLARESAAKSGEVIVVEGYTDVLALHQAGIENCVAIMGTALTPRQVAELGRIAKRVIFALDADSAGQQAMLRALELARERDLELKVMRLTDDKDPCDMLQAGGHLEFEKQLNKAVSLLAFQVSRVLEKHDPASAHERDLALSELLPVFEKVPVSAERDEELRRVAGVLNLPRDLVGHLNASKGGDEAREKVVGVTARGEAAERSFLAMCLALGKESLTYLEQVTDAHLSSEGLREAGRAMLENISEPTTAIDPNHAETLALMSELIVRSKEEPASAPKLKAGFLVLELNRLESEITSARKKEDYERMHELAKERLAIKEEIQSATGAAL